MKAPLVSFQVSKVENKVKEILSQYMQMNKSLHVFQEVLLTVVRMMNKTLFSKKKENFISPEKEFAV